MKSLLLATLLLGASTAAQAETLQNSFNCVVGNGTYSSSLDQQEVQFPTLVFERVGDTLVRGSFVGNSNEGSTSKGSRIEAVSSYCTGRSGGHIFFYDDTAHCSSWKEVAYTETRHLISSNANEVVFTSTLTPKTPHDARILKKAQANDTNVPDLKRTLRCESDLMNQGSRVFVTLHGRAVWASKNRETKSFDAIDLKTGTSFSVPFSKTKINSVGLVDLKQIEHVSNKTLKSITQATCFSAPGAAPATLVIEGKVVKLGTQSYVLGDDGKSIEAGDMHIGANFINDKAFVMSDQSLCFVP